MHGSHVEDYCGAPRGGLTTRCHGYIIGDKSDEGQDASLRVEMGNVGVNHIENGRIQVILEEYL